VDRMGPRRDERGGVEMQDARARHVGKMTVRLRRYMLLVIAPCTIIFPFTDSKMEFLPSVEMMVALSSCTLLIRFDHVAGMWRTL
jgi:hypothetical protein